MGQFHATPVGRPEGTELAACDALAKALDYLPLALDQAAVYMAARAPASASPVTCACWVNPILLDQLSPLPYDCVARTGFSPGSSFL